MGQDGQTELWLQEKYDLDTGIPLATWEEAQLIIAEVEGGAQAVTIINRLHERAGLPPFASTDEEEIRAHVLEERRRELFLESHRVGDVVRLRQALAPAAGTPFTGSLGGSYGGATCLPLPDVERDANPNIP